MTERERQVLAWMRERDPADDDIRWYTDQIGTSARLLNALAKRGLLRRHDPHTNFFVRAGSMCIRWSLSDAGKRAADEGRNVGQARPTSPPTIPGDAKSDDHGTEASGHPMRGVGENVGHGPF